MTTFTGALTLRASASELARKIAVGCYELANIVRENLSEQSTGMEVGELPQFVENCLNSSRPAVPVQG